MLSSPKAETLWGLFQLDGEILIGKCSTINAFLTRKQVKFFIPDLVIL